MIFTYLIFRRACICISEEWTSDMSMQALLKIRHMKQSCAFFPVLVYFIVEIPTYICVNGSWQNFLF